MPYLYEHDNISRAKLLRKQMTKEERRLWFEFLRDYPIKVYRQRAIGPYIVDFYCSKARLVIELDGSQHFQPDGLRKDMERTAYLEQQGLMVLRIPNDRVMKEFENVCEYIHHVITLRLS